MYEIDGIQIDGRSNLQVATSITITITSDVVNQGIVLASILAGFGLSVSAQVAFTARKTSLDETVGFLWPGMCRFRNARDYCVERDRLIRGSGAMSHPRRQASATARVRP